MSGWLTAEATAVSTFSGAAARVKAADLPLDELDADSYGGPQADPAGGADLYWGVEGAEIGRYANAKHAEDDDFGQAGTLVREVMDDEQRATLASNIVGHAGAPEVTQDVKERVVAYWTSVDADLGAKVAGGLNVSNGAGAAQRVAELANRA